MKARFWISRMPIVIGTTIFGAGIYMGYVELINMDTDTNLTRQELSFSALIFLSRLHVASWLHRSELLVVRLEGPLPSLATERRRPFRHASTSFVSLFLFLSMHPEVDRILNFGGDSESTCSDSSQSQGRLYVGCCCDHSCLESYVFNFCNPGRGGNSSCDVYWYQPLSSIAGPLYFLRWKSFSFLSNHRHTVLVSCSECWKVRKHTLLCQPREVG